MASTKIVIIYSVNQSLRRRVIKPADDAHIPIHSMCAEGEAALIVDVEDYEALGADAVLGQYLMAIPQSDRHCIVHNETGDVLAVVNADHKVQADCDAIAPHMLVPHAEACVGWKYDADTQSFIAPPQPDSPADSPPDIAADSSG